MVNMTINVRMHLVISACIWEYQLLFVNINPYAINISPYRANLNLVKLNYKTIMI